MEMGVDEHEAVEHATPPGHAAWQWLREATLAARPRVAVVLPGRSSGGPDQGVTWVTHRAERSLPATGHPEYFR